MSKPATPQSTVEGLELVLRKQLDFSRQQDLLCNLFPLLHKHGQPQNKPSEKHLRNREEPHLLSPLSIVISWYECTNDYLEIIDLFL